MWKNLLIIILCTFLSGCVHGLRCYVDELRPSGCGHLHTKTKILKECKYEVIMYSSTSDFLYQVSLKESVLRCYNISIQMGYLEGVIGGCTLNGGCKEITAQLENIRDKFEYTCLECDWDGCNSSHG